MNLQKLHLHLVVYGCGDSFIREKFAPVVNQDFIKPAGGLWASPVNAKFGWREWCEAERFNSETGFSSKFEIEYVGNTLVIAGASDLNEVVWRYPTGCGIWVPNYEAVIAAGADAIYLTERGEIETRFTLPRNLYGYDCECVFVMNADAISDSQSPQTATDSPAQFSPATFGTMTAAK